MSQVLGQPASAVGPLVLRRFYFFMALLIAFVVVSGFSFTMGRLFDPALTLPRILHLHAVVFFGWVGFFIVQTGLVASRNVALHRRLGLWGVAHGTAVFVVGIATTIVMARYHAAHPALAVQPPSFPIVPFTDMAVFAPLFVLALVNRRKSEVHRRLMLIATCVLTAAAWGRYTRVLGLPPGAFYVGVDMLILLGVARDWFAMRRVHPVYLYALPPIVLAQIAAVTIVLTAPSWWMAVVNAMVR